MGNNKQPSINDFLSKEEQQKILKNMQNPLSIAEQYERSQKLNTKDDLECAMETPPDTERSNCTIYGVRCMLRSLFSSKKLYETKISVLKVGLANEYFYTAEIRRVYFLLRGKWRQLTPMMQSTYEDAEKLLRNYT
jgi:hypothetical protein